MNLVLFLLLIVTISFVRSREYRSYDGTGNNLEHPDWGTVGMQFLRGNGAESWKARYADNASEPIAGRSPRFISNMLPGSGTVVEDPDPISAMHIYWGQFLDHDITRTPGNDDDKLEIPIPADDPIFYEYGCRGNCTMPFSRSEHKMVNGVREQFNKITSYVDGSSVYGSSEDITNGVRVVGSCKLKISKTAVGDMLPKNNGEIPIANDPGKVDISTLFLAGDVRSNENPGLAALHTLFVREHNRLCDEIAEKNPEMDQETLFQEARRWNIAYLQRITFSEYITSTLGNVLPEYTGYNPNVNPGIDTLFSTATFRYGHSEVMEHIPRRAEDYTEFPQGDLMMKDCFFNPACWEDGGIEPIIRGVVTERQNRVDIFYADSIRNFLFGRGPANIVAVDLFARNIERGRDHGLISYNQAREFFGLKPKASFSEVSSDPAVVAALANAYETVDDIEVYAGALAEDHTAEAFIGELLVYSLRDQYTRLRDGDRFYYHNTEVSGFTPEELRIIDGTRLADIIIRNTDITRISCSAFFTSDRFDCGPDADVPDTGGGDLNGTFTGIDGRYQFTWNVDPESETISIVMSGQTSGWVGFGVADPESMGGMIGGDAYIGWVNPDGSLYLGNYDLLSRTVPCDRAAGFGICLNAEGTAQITEASGVEENGWTTIRFTRPLKTDYNYHIPEGFIRIIYANGPEKKLGFHGSDNMERSMVQFWNQGGAPTDVPTTESTTSSGPGPTPSDGCLPTDGEFASALEYLQGDYRLHFTVNRDDHTISVAAAGRTEGWVGIGVSQGDAPRMIGSHATAGFLLGGATPVISAWNLNQQDEGQVNRDNSITLTDTTVCFEGGFTVIRFTRSLNDWDIRIEEANGTQIETPIVLAFGEARPTTADRLTYHRANRVGVLINFVTGTSDVVKDYTRLIHGIAMLTGWGLLNIGAIYARFTKKSAIPAFWFKWHRPLQYTGFTIALLGFLWIIIIKMIGGEQHFNQPYFHGVGGLLTMSLAMIQVMGAFFRPHPTPETFIRKFWEWKHHIMGRTSLFLAIATAFIGVANLSGSFDNIFVGVFIGVICAWLVILAAFEQAKWAVEKHEREAHLYYKME